MLIIIYLFRDFRVPFWVGSHFNPKITIECTFQACNDDCWSLVSRSDGPRAIQRDMQAFIVDVIPIWRKILRFSWLLQYIQI